MSIDLQIVPVNFEVDDNVFETLSIVTSNCPKCNCENSLIITYRKDRYVKKDKTHSNLKIECVRCKWKVVDNFKWNANLNT